MFNNLKADLKRHTPFSPYVLFEQGLWAVIVYRYGRWVRNVQVPLVSLFLRMTAFVLFKAMEVTTGISIPASAKIGKGFFIGHFGGIIVHAEVQMGENCSIGPGVVIGARGLGRQGVPQLGNNVYVGVGAKILGHVKIGNNVRIGANAVVITDVPDNATVIGVPGRIIEKS